MSTTLFDNRKSVIHRLNPVTKLFALLAIIVTVFAIPIWWVAGLIVVFVVAQPTPTMTATATVRPDLKALRFILPPNSL